MVDCVGGYEAKTDEDGDGEEEAGKGGPTGAVAVGEVACDRGEEARDEDAEEKEARGSGVPGEGLFDVEGEDGVPGQPE